MKITKFFIGYAGETWAEFFYKGQRGQRCMAKGKESWVWIEKSDGTTSYSHEAVNYIVFSGPLFIEE